MKPIRSIQPPTPEVVAATRAGLERADYTADAVLDAIGPAGQADLERNHGVAAARALGGRDDPLATLIRLFILQQAQPAVAVAAAGLTGLVGAGLLTAASRAEGAALDGALDEAPGEAAGRGDPTAPGDDGPVGMIRAAVDIRPYADESTDVAGWVVSDQTATLDTARGRPPTDHVLGISPASVSLSQITPWRPIGRALDLGTGSGVQCLRLARQADQVVATDLNPRALALARWTFDLNGLTVDQRLGSLYQPVANDTFDLIMTNPPFVIAPPGPGRLLYRETGLPGDDAMRTVVAQAGARLNDGGSLHVVGNWAHVRGQPWGERLAGWVPSGCDAVIVQRERLDPYEYAEVWLADAGWTGSARYRRRLDDWLAYFDLLDIEAVGLGWVALVKSGRAGRRVTCLDWGSAVVQPVADDLMAHLAAFDLADLSVDALLDTAWRLAPGVIQTIVGRPGLAEPDRVMFTRSDGLGRAIDLDAALAGVLGACDGELTLRQIVLAVADLLTPSGVGADPAALISRLVPDIRRLIADTWLTSGPGTRR